MAESSNESVKAAVLTNHETKRELNRLHREMLERQVYFLTAAAGACIGYALSKTECAKAPNWLVLMAVAFWLVTFISGFVHMNALRRHIGINVQKISAEIKVIQRQSLIQELSKNVNFPAAAWGEFCKDLKEKEEGLKELERGLAEANSAGECVWHLMAGSLLFGVIFFAVSELLRLKVIGS